jgi:hypothetical protein
MLEKHKGHSKMDNPEKLETQGTQNTMTKKKQKNPTQYALEITIHKTQDEDKKPHKKHTTHMCWTPSYTRHKTKTNKTKNTTQGVSTTIHKTQDEDKKKKKKHNTMCV